MRSRHYCKGVLIVSQKHSVRALLVVSALIIITSVKDVRYRGLILLWEKEKVNGNSASDIKAPTQIILLI